MGMQNPKRSLQQGQGLGTYLESNGEAPDEGGCSIAIERSSAVEDE